jgi:hypothetical protein
MGSDGYRLAAESTCTDGVILEVGSGVSTEYLVTMGPLVTTIDLEHQPMLGLPRCRYLTGQAEELLTRWHEPGVGDGRQVCFAWLDGYDWPYDDLPPDVLGRQATEYEQAGLVYSKQASQQSHLTIARLIAPWMAVGGVVAFDDTWQVGGGWDGKGGTAVPWLLAFADRGGLRFELWRTQADTEPRHNGYVAVRKVR